MTPLPASEAFNLSCDSYLSQQPPPTKPNFKMEVPTATSLKDIYPESALADQTKRWEQLLSKFKSEYAQQADFVSRSPGRVNIIGEVSPCKHELLYFYQKRRLKISVIIRLTIVSTLITRYTKSFQWPARSTSFLL